MLTDAEVFAVERDLGTWCAVDSAERDETGRIERKVQVGAGRLVGAHRDPLDHGGGVRGAHGRERVAPFRYVVKGVGAGGVGLGHPVGPRDEHVGAEHAAAARGRDRAPDPAGGLHGQGTE
ncbi:hypothetical protein D3C86_1288630 [compost metagenome]